MKQFPKKFALSVLIILSIGLYLLTIKGVGYNPGPLDFKNKLDQSAMPLELSPERGRFALTLSLVENHSFALTQTLADGVYPDVGYYNGRFYIEFAPGISLLAVPLYIVGHYFGLSQVFTFFLSSIFAVFNIIFIYLISKRVFKLPVWASFFGSLVFAFGSTSWAYAVTLYQHQATTCFILSAFYSAWKYRQKSRFSWAYALWIWTAAGLAVAIDYPNALFMLPVLVYFFFSSFDMTILRQKINLSFRPLIIISSIAFVFLIGVHGYYNYIQFGSPLRLSSSLVGYKDIKEQQLLNTEERKSLIKQEAESNNPVKFFSEEKFPMGLTILTVSPDRGLFLYSPIFILGFLGLFLAQKKLQSWETSTLLETLLAIFFLYSSWGDPWGGWGFGPRYLIPALGILSVFISYCLASVKSLFVRIFAFLLFAYSSAIALLGVLTTNAVPPRVEAVALHSGYNFMFNWLFFRESRSSSYIYNTYFYHQIPLWEYALPIYILLLLAAIIFLFILPRFSPKHVS